MRREARAFTLLEMMIALAAAAIVAAFAVPGWRNHIARGHRIDAVSALYRAAQYADAQGAAAASLPAGIDQAPPSGHAVYRLKLLSGDESNGGYAIVASPTAAGPMRDDSCGAFVLDANGARSNEGSGNNLATGDCWKDR
ncbi:type IV pilus assembly protein PilE [Paraburkholderia bannensis]|uniref:Type IV pilus assembly protein PilE n=1 Tax=Paraburkholderia bannensis TaxID=765414 RepID=A0A7W9TSD5_9BURK|nr:MULTISPECIES: type IV pilin protein [Paraburkholderia]MBB3255365.1 type IV pilus assembly protein PilE [Paraburkholderia sp. WP4_3_2]MBB6100623.1 type IV pilus assembly protein PilE [Paraburkholderia bannensis]